MLHIGLANFIQPVRLDEGDDTFELGAHIRRRFVELSFRGVADEENGLAHVGSTSISYMIYGGEFQYHRSPRHVLFRRYSLSSSW